MPLALENSAQVLSSMAPVVEAGDEPGGARYSRPFRQERTRNQATFNRSVVGPVTPGRSCSLNGLAVDRKGFMAIDGYLRRDL